MKKVYLDYAKAIVIDLLQLRLGDALSINTEENDLEFAKQVARTALEITNVTVKIVLTEKGKPTDVIEFDPEPPASAPKGFVMLRLANRTQEKIQGKVLDIKVEADDMSAMQKLGHLAEPVLLDRRIAVPWCVVTVYDQDDPKWEEIESRISSSLSDLDLLTTYRTKSLNCDKDRVLTFKGKEADFSLTIPQGCAFVSGHQVLGSGREFLSSSDFDIMSAIVDKNSLNGHFKAKMCVLGKEQELELIFEKGLLISYSESAQMDRLIELDEGLRRPGYISLRDNEVVLYLGGALTDSLEIRPEREEDLPDFFNCSLFTIKCIVSEKLDMGLNVQQIIIKDGLFVE